MNDKPKLTYETIKRMEDMSWFTYAKIFDDLIIVAQKETACFVWDTSDGIVIFDGIWPDKAAYDSIINAIKSIGWDPENICKYIITHGHVDHTGCGKWLVSNHNITTYLSKRDDAFWQDHPTKPDRPETWKNFNIDCYIDEGDIIDCGDKQIKVINTPGHTPGCLSYIFPVYEHGEKHVAALFGGATPPWNEKEDIEIHKQSIDHFIKVAIENKTDVALSNHTAFDNGIERIAYSKKRLSYMPNIYILGKKGFEKFCSVYKRICMC